MNRVAIIFFVAYALVLVGVKSAYGQEREEFLLACDTVEAAKEFIEQRADTCYIFEDRYGFSPKGFLEPVDTVGDFTIYYVDWGNGATGVYTLK